MIESPPTNERDDFQLVAFMEHGGGVPRAGDDLQVQLDRHMRLRYPQLGQQLRYRSPTGNFARLAIHLYHHARNHLLFSFGGFGSSRTKAVRNG